MDPLLRVPVLAVAAAFCSLAATSPFAPADAQKMVRRYCIGCHNEQQKTGGVSLAGIEPAAVAQGAATWEKVLRKTRSGEMPPVNLPRPQPEDRQAFTNWLERELDAAAKARPDPGAPVVHRLNRAEYTNAVRDLLALDLDHGATLPADDSGYGFDNIGSVLTVSPSHMEKYLSTARRVTRLALGTARLSPAIERVNLRGMMTEPYAELPVSLRDGVALRRYFPVDAEYSILVRLRGNPPANLPAPRLDLRLDGARIKLWDARFENAEEAQGSRNFEFRLPVKAGLHVVAAGFLNESARLETGALSGGRRGFTPPPPAPAMIEYLQFAGPFNPSGPGATESRRRIFGVCQPGVAGLTEEMCARRILASLARRAYRRPVGPADLDPLLKLFVMGREDGKTFESGIETALRGILVSPNFLFRVEKPAAGPGGMRKLTELELASRLSFFLWSSIPDEPLLRAAEAGRLRTTLAAEVRRMLADPKANAVVDNFAGQWLRLRNVADWKPDPEKYPQFDQSLRQALQRETELFFASIIREDRSVAELLSAGYTFLNERLARHYGIEGVHGPYYRRVTLAGEERGGILTHGSILTVTSYPTRTSPVLRGKWILDNILGAPPPPPPADVPDLEDHAANSARDLRAALEKHRASAACASCHSRLDPLGFSLENYDATGRFRQAEDGVDIDSSGQLPGGAAFAGAGGLKRVLLEQQDAFIECFAEKLLTYALGRGLEHYDLPAVREIRRQAARGGYRFSSVALAIVNSVPFQMRRNPEP